MVLAGVLLPGAAIAAPGGPPVPADDVITIEEGGSASGNVLANDRNNGGGTLAVTGFVALPPTVGTLTVDADGAYSFTAAPDWFGSTATTYTVANDTKTRDGNILITVTNSNDPPAAGNDALVVEEDTPTDVTAAVLANDTDPDGDTLSVGGVSNAVGGTADLSSGVVTFTPAANECGAGTAGFDYEITDGSGGTAAAHATVDVTCVNDVPVAVGDTLSGTEDTAVVADAASLAGNDTDVELEALTVTGVSNATAGTVALDAGVITFSPAADACGTDVAGFDYAVEDASGGSATGQVTVSLTCVNDNPAPVGDTLSTTEDTALVLDAVDLTGNDADADGDTLAVAGVANATGGAVALDGSSITFTPAADECGAGLGAFDYELSDANGGSAAGSVVVDVSCVNDAPVATPDDLAGTEDTGVVVDAADLAANDTDADGDPVTIVGLSEAVGGTVGLVDGTITFTPAANACGLDVAGFDYTVLDGNGGSATGHATIDLDCVNDLPVAGADFASVDNVSGPADHAVLGNDTDAEGDPITLVDASVPAEAGTAGVQGDLVRFTPAAGFSGEALVTYTVSDGTGSASGTLTVTVGPDVTAPVVRAATVAFGKGRVNESAPLKVSWSAVDASTGVNLYEVQVSIGGGTWKSVYAGAGTSITKAYAFNRTLVWRVRASDRAGNVSAWVSSATRKLLAYQNSSSAITRKGTWRTVASSTSSGTGYATTRGKGNRMSLAFTGRSVLFVAPKTSAGSWVKVYVDGVLVGRYSLYRSSTLVGQQIASRTWASSGKHTIRIVSDTTTKRANMDAFIVLR
jgi:hypothetical protein